MQAALSPAETTLRRTEQESQASLTVLFVLHLVRSTELVMSKAIMKIP